MEIVETINDALTFIDGYLGSAGYFPYLLIGVGVFFTLYLGFPQIRYFGQATRIVRGQYAKKDSPGDTSHFQALTTALSGTVGTGNIGGVALAIFIGGPAALFWMWVTAFFGMTTKFVEVTLSHKYREKTEDGTMAGGPMYFMEKKLNMKWLAVLFAMATIISSIGSGNMPQINNIAEVMSTTFHIEKWITGGVLAILLAMVIIGGIKRIAKVAEKVVPFMAVVYVVGAILVIAYNYENILPSFQAIFGSIFSGSSAVGGFLGASFAYAMDRGVNRGLFSNEAGQGSAAIAHSAAKGKEPASEGMVSLLEPFIDTIIICTLTGLVILSSGVWSEKHFNKFDRADMEFVVGDYTDSNEEHVKKLMIHLDEKRSVPSEIKPFTGTISLQEGKVISDGFTLLNSRSVAEEVTYLDSEGNPLTGEIPVSEGRLEDSSITVQGKSLIHSANLTALAFTKGYMGESGKYIVSLGLLLFAFTTAIAWSYYGDRASIYLFGPKAVMPYRIAFVALFFLGAIVDSTVVWTLAYVTVALMTIPNLIGITLLHKDMKNTVKDYWKNFKQDQAD
ncbi:alanine/glycine:cation symporter family protein [Kangiella koreensis]|uniref:Amino acid carrier protein n=1 Tax=Kangiella koreensis (strain DSM 16069 / JCM 12317 / KCTC 12182 / SW-125) TaxID=523791 RepID=C7RC29_KANKD|nr:sodium:alanine symporter family protein [Kangiella koreensis]ACV26821.1 amino acid carrier protein [Kangiella koreensis DSM 16069]